VAVHLLLEAVDVVQRDAGNRRAFRFDVARHREVDQQQRAVARAP
jgi:hypothetical protein